MKLPSSSTLLPSARRFLTTACAALSVAACIPQASAGEVDGTYRITRISSSNDLPISKDLIADTVGSGNRITISDNQIPIAREKWLDVLNVFNFVFDGGTSKISGPKSVALEPSGDSWVGRTSRPVVVRLTGDFLGLEVRMDLRVTCRAKVAGDKLTLTLPVRVRTDGEVDASGTVRVVARKE